MTSLSLNHVLEIFGGGVTTNRAAREFKIRYGDVVDVVSDNEFGTVLSDLERQLAKEIACISITPVSQRSWFTKKDFNKILAEQPGTTMVEKLAALDVKIAALEKEPKKITMAELIELTDYSDVEAVVLKGKTQIDFFKKIFPDAEIDGGVGYVSGYAPKYDAKDLLDYLKDRMTTQPFPGADASAEEPPVAQAVAAVAEQAQEVQGEAAPAGVTTEVARAPGCDADRKRRLTDRMKNFQVNLNSLPEEKLMELCWVKPEYANMIPKTRQRHIAKELPRGPASVVDFVDQAKDTLDDVLNYIPEEDHDYFIIGQVIRLKGAFKYEKQLISKK